MKFGQKNNLESMDKYLEDEDIKLLQRPTRLDSCFFIPKEAQEGSFPMRPIALNDFSLNLSQCHVASMEHLANTYRVYFYGDSAKGVFRGQDEMLVTESIPKEDEWPKFVGLLIFDEGAYQKKLKEWKQYWEWMENRNEARWLDQEKGKLNYDQKNMMHCIRLLLCAKNIFENGSPIVRFEGEQQELLMSIRSGEFEYNALMEMAETLMEETKALKDKSDLPEKVDQDKAVRIYKEIYQNLRS